MIPPPPPPPPPAPLPLPPSCIQLGHVGGRWVFLAAHRIGAMGMPAIAMSCITEGMLSRLKKRDQWRGKGRFKPESTPPGQHASELSVICRTVEENALKHISACPGDVCSGCVMRKTLISASCFGVGRCAKPAESRARSLTHSTALHMGSVYDDVCESISSGSSSRNRRPRLELWRQQQQQQQQDTQVPALPPTPIQQSQGSGIRRQELRISAIGPPRSLQTTPPPPPATTAPPPQAPADLSTSHSASGSSMHRTYPPASTSQSSFQSPGRPTPNPRTAPLGSTPHESHGAPPPATTQPGNRSGTPAVFGTPAAFGTPVTPLPETLRGLPTPFPQCQISLAIDTSGSTSGRVIASEREFVTKVVLQLVQGNVQQNVHVLPWSNTALRPCLIANLHRLKSGGGTDPAVLLKSEQHLAALKRSNVWFLLTDGQVSTQGVNNLANTLTTKSMHGVPCVIVIFGTGCSNPSGCDISVGISPFAAVPNSALLYQNITSRTCYVLGTKGCFNKLLPDGATQPILDDGTRWADLPTIRPDMAFENIIIPAARELAPGELALSNDLTIDFNNLFSSDLDDGQINNLLGNEDHLQTILLSSHSRGQFSDTLTWLERQGSVSATGVTGDNAARSAIRDISAAVANRRSSGPEFERLVQGLRETHRTNAMHRHSRSRVIDNAISSLYETSNSGFQSSSLSSSRPSFRPSGPHPSIPGTTDHFSRQPTSKRPVSRAFKAPVYKSFKGDCGICYETNIVLTVLLKRPHSYNAATARRNVRLVFPLSAGGAPENDIISTFLVCENCAVYLVEAGETPFREKATSALPLVSWTEQSSQWRGTLLKALDCFTPDSISVLPLLFFAILDHTIQTKEWAKADGSEENRQRHRALTWCRDMILDEVKMNGGGTKGVVGEWCKQIVATPGNSGLLWKYPMDGFVLIIEVAKRRGLSLELLTKVVWKKLLHQVTARYMFELDHDVEGKGVTQTLDFALSKVAAPGWIDEMTKPECRLVGRGDLKILKKLADELGWVENVAGAAMGKWLGWLRGMGPGKSTAEAIEEIMVKWGYQVVAAFEVPEELLL